MVDRIVPATTDADIAALAARIGCEDRAMVKTERFFQWVIEDRFCGPRPDFAALGAQLTTNIAPWEEAKLRLLNGAHSAIAYLGGLAGIDHVHEFVAGLAERQFIEALWDESTTTLSPPSELDLPRYRQALMARFANPALMHSIRQIAMDGSQKIPQRLLAPIAHRLDHGREIDALGLAVAAWMRWQGGLDDAGHAFDVEDPLAATTARAVSDASTVREIVSNLLRIGAVFPERLASDDAFRRSLEGHLRLLAESGAAATIKRYGTGHGSRLPA
jgi:fructuronate reductase